MDAKQIENKIGMLKTPLARAEYLTQISKRGGMLKYETLKNVEELREKNATDFVKYMSDNSTHNLADFLTLDLELNTLDSLRVIEKTIEKYGLTSKLAMHYEDSLFKGEKTITNHADLSGAYNNAINYRIYLAKKADTLDVKRANTKYATSTIKDFFNKEKATSYVSHFGKKLSELNETGIDDLVGDVFFFAATEGLKIKNSNWTYDYSDAAEHYEKAFMLDKAAQCYDHAGYGKKAIMLYKKAAAQKTK